MFDQDNANKHSLEFRRSIILLFPFAIIFCLTLIHLFSLTILPLVIPSYIGALTYVSVFSPKGLFVEIFSFIDFKY